MPMISRVACSAKGPFGPGIRARFRRLVACTMTLLSFGSLAATALVTDGCSPIQLDFVPEPSDASPDADGDAEHDTGDEGGGSTGDDAGYDANGDFDANGNFDANGDFDANDDADADSSFFDDADDGSGFGDSD